MCAREHRAEKREYFILWRFMFRYFLFFFFSLLSSVMFVLFTCAIHKIKIIHELDTYYNWHTHTHTVCLGEIFMFVTHSPINRGIFLKCVGDFFQISRKNSEFVGIFFSSDGIWLFITCIHAILWYHLKLQPLAIKFVQIFAHFYLKTIQFSPINRCVIANGN